MLIIALLIGLVATKQWSIRSKEVNGVARQILTEHGYACYENFCFTKECHVSITNHRHWPSVSFIRDSQETTFYFGKGWYFIDETLVDEHFFWQSFERHAIGFYTEVLHEEFIDGSDSHH